MRDYNFHALGAHIVKHSKCACSPILCYFILGFFYPLPAHLKNPRRPPHSCCVAAQPSLSTADCRAHLFVSDKNICHLLLRKMARQASAPYCRASSAGRPSISVTSKTVTRSFCPHVETHIPTHHLKTACPPPSSVCPMNFNSALSGCFVHKTVSEIPFHLRLFLMLI